MLSGVSYVFTLAAVLGSGLVAGIFFAFSTFVMRALGRRPTPEGIAAMQAINVTVINPWFFLVFFGTAVLCLPLAYIAIGDAFAWRRFYVMAACALYVFGCILVTIGFYVPLNNRLASVAPHTPEAEALWAHYLSRWTFWNHVRTATSLGAAGLFAVSL